MRKRSKKRLPFLSFCLTIVIGCDGSPGYYSFSFISGGKSSSFFSEVSCGIIIVSASRLFDLFAKSLKNGVRFFYFLPDADVGGSSFIDFDLCFEILSPSSFWPEYLVSSLSGAKALFKS